MLWNGREVGRTDILRTTRDPHWGYTLSMEQPQEVQLEQCLLELVVYDANGGSGQGSEQSEQSEQEAEDGIVGDASDERGKKKKKKKKRKKKGSNEAVPEEEAASPTGFAASLFAALKGSQVQLGKRILVGRCRIEGEELAQVGLSLSLSLRLKGLFLYTDDILTCNVECCIRQLWYSSIISYNISSLA